MPRLDCESLETTLASLSYAFEISDCDIHKILRGSRIEEGYGACDELFAQFTLNRSYRCFEETCFFHASRVPRNTTFDEGLVPLNEVIDRTSNFLYTLVSENISRADWEACVGDTINSGSSSLAWKLKNQKGPFGFLFKESAMSEGSFLKGPDLVFDFHKATLERFNLDLMKLYEEQTEPVVVKFFCPAEKGSHYLKCALFNTFIKIKRLDWSISHCAIDRKGVAIAFDSILGIHKC